MPKQVKNNAHIEIKADIRVALEIRKDDADGMKKVISLSSVVEEVLEEGCLLIQMPFYQGYHYPLPRDNPLLMSFFIGSRMYALLVQFQEWVRQENFLYAKVRRVGRIKLYQRRDCYRLPCSLPVMVERFWRHERVKYPEPQPSEGQMINFSDGGMLFSTNEDIETGEKLTLTFDMGRIETIEGMTLRTEKAANGKYKYKVAVQYLYEVKDKSQKRRFYKYIVEKQMEKRRWQTQDMQDNW